MLKCIRMLTFIPVDEIDEMSKWDGSMLNRAKEILAHELTETVHGKEAADAAEASARALFGAGDGAEVPTALIPESDLQADGTADILTMLVGAGLVSSRSEARRAVEQGGVTADGEKVTDIRASFSGEKLRDGILLRRGKKAFKKLMLK